MTTVSTPVSTWVASLLTLTGVNQSSSLTVTVHVTAGWEVQIPIQFSHNATVSADPVCSVYASMDGGANYDSNPFTVFVLPRTAGGGGMRQTSIRLSTGQYCLQLLNSGPNSQLFAVLTQLVITAIQNV
jgi:hypothetical protein